MDAYILLLSQRLISLFSFENNQLKEIRDGIFPVVLPADYEFARPVLGTSFGYAMKGFEKDKSISKKERFARLLQETDKNLKQYLTPESSLIIAGTDQNRWVFKRASAFRQLITHELAGGYTNRRPGHLLRGIREVMKSR
jgi:hypothetical protein